MLCQMTRAAVDWRLSPLRVVLWFNGHWGLWPYLLRQRHRQAGKHDCSSTGQGRLNFITPGLKWEILVLHPGTLLWNHVSKLSCGDTAQGQNEGFKWETGWNQIYTFIPEGPNLNVSCIHWGPWRKHNTSCIISKIQLLNETQLKVIWLMLPSIIHKSQMSVFFLCILHLLTGFIMWTWAVHAEYCNRLCKELLWLGK